MAEQIEQITMQNGIRVVLEPMPYVKTAAFGIYVAAGSAYETKENNGISHMIEHMMFKGTKTQTAKQLADRMATLGDTVNAYTGKEYTAYYGVTIAEELQALINILSDMLLNSVFEKGALSKEKGVVLEEIDMYNNSPDDLVHELAQKRVWRTHPLGFQISGTKELVKGFTSEKLQTYYRNHYRPERTVLSVAGAFQKDDVLKQLEALFCPAGAASSAKLRRDGVAPDGRYGKFFAGEHRNATKEMQKKAAMEQKKQLSDISFLPPRKAAEYTRSFCTAKRDTSQLHMNLVFPGISYLDEKRHIATVFHSVLGGSNNSLLFQKIREEEGLAYSVYSYGCPYAREGLLHMEAVSAPAQAEEIFQRILQVCEFLRTTDVDEETLRTHKSLIKTEAILSKESVQSRMEGNGRAMLLRGRVIPQEEDLQAIEQVTSEEIRDFANQTLRPELMSICLVGEMGSAGGKLKRIYEKL